MHGVRASREMSVRGLAAIVAMWTVFAAGACGGDPVRPDGVRLAFDPATLVLGAGRSGEATLRNTGSEAAEAIRIVPGEVADASGDVVAGATAIVDPTEIARLETGATRTIAVALQLPSCLPGGSYTASLDARLGAQAAATLAIDFTAGGVSTSRSSIAITFGPTTAREGDVVRYGAEVRDENGAPIANPALAWCILPPDAGLITSEGAFVGYLPGPARVVASAGGAGDTLDIQITARALAGSFGVVGHGVIMDRFTSDLWVHPTAPAAYTATWGGILRDSDNNGAGLPGNRVYAWDISDPAAPVLTDSVEMDARTVNDVKVHPDGSLAVATHEGSADGQNGITLLSLADPLHPTVITRFTLGLQTGVHNVWVEGDFVYVVVDRNGRGMRIVDISEPARPETVAAFPATDPSGVPSFLHDIYVRDGLAFLSQWDDGLVIVDVGNGIAGGSPANPTEVSRIEIPGYSVHNTWYWPEAGYAFLGDEIKFAGGLHGTMQVVDVSDLTNPRRVASYRVPTDVVASSSPHNFWLDESRGIIYLAWYEAGIRAVDVSGALLGELEAGGREIAAFIYGNGSGCFGVDATCMWAPQLQDGLVYLSDLNTGLWVMEPQP